MNMTVHYRLACIFAIIPPIVTTKPLSRLITDNSKLVIIPPEFVEGIPPEDLCLFSAASSSSYLLSFVIRKKHRFDVFFLLHIHGRINQK
jgi:hypothetical protein